MLNGAKAPSHNGAGSVTPFISADRRVVKSRASPERKTKSGEFKAAAPKKDNAEKPKEDEEKPEDLKRLGM